MNKIQEIEVQFRELHESVVKEYEERLEDLKEEQARRQNRLQEDEKETRNLLRASGIDGDHFENLERKDAEDLKKYLKDVRPKLVGRPTRRALDFREQSMRSELASQNCSIVLRPYAASLLVPEKRLIEGIEGEAGNPWILPNNPEDINIKYNSTGSGWGCWAVGAAPPVEYHVWFNFIPSQDGAWNFLALFSFRGFYILKANDRWYNCKSAEVLTELNMNVNQYFWRGQKNFKLIDESRTNIERHRFFDESNFYDYATYLRAGDITWISVKILLDAFANGSGSYAEVNFADGAANYIRPEVLVVWPS